MTDQKKLILKSVNLNLTFCQLITLCSGSAILFLSGCSTARCPDRPQNLVTSEVKTPLVTGIKQMSKVKVYKPDGTLQCQQGEKLSIDKMALELKDIPIYTKENKHDGLMRIQMCGKPTGNNHVFEIDEVNLEKAIGLGFKKWVR